MKKIYLMYHCELRGQYFFFNIRISFIAGKRKILSLRGSDKQKYKVRERKI